MRRATISLVGLLLVAATSARAEYSLVYVHHDIRPHWFYFEANAGNGGPESPEWSVPWTGDFDGDGHQEALIKTSIAPPVLTILDLATGIVEVDLPLLGMARMDEIIIMDVDGDEYEEIIVAESNNAIGLVDFVGVVGSVDPVGEVPPTSVQIVPHPTSATTRVVFEVRQNGVVELQIFDVQGRNVRSMNVGRDLMGSRTSVVWDGSDDRGRDLGSGTYFLQVLVDGRQVATEKLLLVR